MRAIQVLQGLGSDLVGLPSEEECGLGNVGSTGNQPSSQGPVRLSPSQVTSKWLLEACLGLRRQGAFGPGPKPDVPHLPPSPPNHWASDSVCPLLTTTGSLDWKGPEKSPSLPFCQDRRLSLKDDPHRQPVLVLAPMSPCCWGQCPNFQRAPCPATSLPCDLRGTDHAAPGHRLLSCEHRRGQPLEGVNTVEGKEKRNIQ